MTVIRRFERWRENVDQDHGLDTFDLALGFYAGRYPKRHHRHACEFAAKARDRAAESEMS